VACLGDAWGMLGDAWALGDAWEMLERKSLLRGCLGDVVVVVSMRPAGTLYFRLFLCWHNFTSYNK
jgi:hypothetical protein